MVAYRRGGSRRYVLALLLLTAVTLVTLDSRSGESGVLGFAGRAAHQVVSPVAVGVHAVTGAVADWFDGVTSAGSLKRENDRLRQDLAEAESKARRGDAALQENRRYKDLLDLEVPEDAEAVTADVILGPSGNYESTIVIDKGSSAGIAKGMPVVAAEGLVGRVVEVWPNGAKVLLITDPRSGVSVRMVRPRLTGEAEGRAGRSTLVLDLVEPAAPAPRFDVVVGDDAVTSGLEGSVYPPGFLVGEVLSIESKPGTTLHRLIVRPFVDFSRLEIVRVLRWTPSPAAPEGR